MKVLMINVVCGIRSTGRICTDLAVALEQQGHEVKIAYGRENVPEQFQKYAVRIGSELDTKIHGVKARLLDRAGFGSKKATEKFVKWIKEYDPSVIHLHNIHGYYLNIEVLFKYLKSCGKKIIWTLHDCWAFTGHSAYCDAVGCEKWKNGCEKCPQIREYPKSYVDSSKKNWQKKKQLFSNVSNMTIVTPSKWLAGLVKESYLKEYPVEVIYNGIDTSQFKPLQNEFKQYYGLENKTMLLGVATAWDNMKGLSDFIKLSELIDESYKIVLVGLTAEQKNNLPERILGIERTTSVKELAQIYSAADVFLNLSHCENYPTVNLEARACGLPIITYNVSESPESAGRQCIVVPKGDLSAIVTILRDKKYGENNDSEKVLDKEEMEHRYLDSSEGYWKVKKKYNLIGKFVILGVAAVWDRRKGLETFIKLNEILDAKYQIILVGLQSQQIDNLPKGIIGIGRTNSVADLVALYAIADVFINPTLEDNYPTTNLESIACKTPVVTFETGGSIEGARIYGTSVPKRDIDGLIKAIESINQIEYERTSIDYKDTVKKYIELYED